MSSNNLFSFFTDDMVEYLQSFNYLKEKYLIDDPDLLEQLEKIEKNEQYGKLQKMSPAYVGQTANRVYGFSYKERVNSAKIYNSVLSTIINEFLNIKGLELLFNEHYYDFEWDMHLEYNVETSEYKYYRDHMEHQVRNMYMMLKLLDDYDCGFIYEIKRLLLNKSNSKVSDYVSTRLKEFTFNKFFSTEQKELLFNCALCYYTKAVDEYLKNNSHKLFTPFTTCEDFILSLLNYFEVKGMIVNKVYFRKEFFDFFKVAPSCIFSSWCISIGDCKNKLGKLFNKLDREKVIDSYFNDYSLGFIIRSAAIISALFHDVSYPLCFFMNMQKRIGQYLPSMNAIIHNVEADLDRIVSLLQPSLLFVLVSEKEIRAKLTKSQDKYDHGVFSAIALLLTFYESGRIHQLSIDKQIAIELAALAIYNHNFDYNIVKENAKEYYRPVFTQNPISYLLKICDEMQEWDRRYFELSKEDENIFCPDCGSPIIKHKQYDNNKYKETYICKCHNGKEKFYKKSTFFNCRDMYTVTTCHSVDVISNNYNLIFKLNYDLLDLLHMTQISCTYASYRAKELNKLKVLMLNQKYSDTDSLYKVKNLYLDYIMSANPLYLKAKILLAYILQQYKNENQNLNMTNNDFQQKIDDTKYILTNNINIYFSNLAFEVAPLVPSDKDEKSIRKFFNKFSDTATNLFEKNVLQNFQDIANDVIFILGSHDNDFYIKKINNSLQASFSSLITDASIQKKIFESPEWAFLCDKLDNLLEKKRYTLVTSYIGTKLTKYYEKSNRNATIVFNEVDKLKLHFYFKLAGYIFTSEINNILLPTEKDFIKDMFSPEAVPYENADSLFATVIKELLSDVYAIMSNQVDVYNDDIIDLEKYTKQFQSEDKVYQLIDKYINPVNWYDATAESYNNFSENNLDFHSDLYLFELMGQAIKEKENEEEEPVKSTSKKTK